MIFRPGQGFIAAKGDACYECGRFIGGKALCAGIGFHLVPALLQGMRLVIVQCPAQQDPENVGRKGAEGAAGPY
ncbi:MAG: hypothetical protein JRI59_06805 [Deltaproteobacteria bacterium]|nr:hypothetical protein [Deltaproteobacteria bacterium]